MNTQQELALLVIFIIFRVTDQRSHLHGIKTITTIQESYNNYQAIK